MSLITAQNLTETKPSTTWLQQLKPSLVKFVGSGDPLLDVLDVDCPQRHVTHHIFSLGLKDLVENKSIDDGAKLAAWRFLTGGHPDLKVGAGCHAPEERQGVPAKVTGALQVAEILDLLESTQQLNDLAEVKNYPDHVYEVRVLRIPGLYLEAFWLKATTGQPDLFVPYGLLLDKDRQQVKLPAGGKLRKMGAMKEGEFLKTVRPLAQKRLASNSAPHPLQHVSRRTFG